MVLNQDSLYDIAKSHNNAKGSAFNYFNVLSAYDSGGLFSKVVDKPSMDCVAKGISIKGDED